jgi:hypothetical protein
MTRDAIFGITGAVGSKLEADSHCKPRRLMSTAVRGLANPDVRRGTGCLVRLTFSDIGEEICSKSGLYRRRLDSSTASSRLPCIDAVDGVFGPRDEASRSARASRDPRQASGQECRSLG